ncbi:hypothetical protein C1H46_014675 [Malus baccata]|uniref:Uncharacterized protein n=1 Tax=Malus baccata TaxID=106549 RepID=A0A540MLQ1_MALBA|nr:hypothetical protein C1H46_014675 [Malus baccata]
MGGSTSSSSKSRTTTTKNKSVHDRTLTYAGNLIKLLPTGSLLVPVPQPCVDQQQQLHRCQQIPKRHSHRCFRLLLLLCFLHRQGSDGQTHYGVATSKGLCPSTSSNSVDLSAYKLRFGDFVHGFFSLIVFAVVSLLDANTVRYYYPGFESTEKILLQELPQVIGTIAGTVFAVFPNKRHGIGYPSSSPDSSQDSASAAS